MYSNSNFDSIIERNEEKRLSGSVLCFLQSYYKQRRFSDLNPFNIPVIFEANWNISETHSLLEFLYVNGVKSFVYADESTASLRVLTSILSDPKYSASITNGYRWESKEMGNYSRSGVLIEIKRKRK